MTDPFDSDEWREWAKAAEDDLIPKLKDSGLTMSIVPKGESDIKFAVELGLSIMMNKPIIALVTPGAHVPEKLLKVVDELLEVDLGNPEEAAPRIQAAISRIVEREKK